MTEVRLPLLNEQGLALPPSAEDLAPVDARMKDWEMQEHHGSGHHLYWPGRYYFNSGAIAYSFRKHRLNFIKGVAREEHNNIHWRYDQFVRTNPQSLMPSEKIMKKFLEDAIWVDRMWEYAETARDLFRDINAANDPNDALARHDRFVSMVRQSADYALGSLVLPTQLVQIQIEAADLLLASSQQAGATE